MRAVFLLLAIASSFEPGPTGTTTPASYRWVSGEQYDYLYDRDQQVGAIEKLTGVYTPYNASSRLWGEPCRPPIDPREGVRANHGVVRERISTKERFTLNGETSSRSQVMAELVRDDQVPDDTHKLRLVLIGRPDDTSKVQRLLESNADLRSLRDSFVLQVYQPDDWALRPGFVLDGTPTVYLQEPAGRVLYRSDSAEDFGNGATLAGEIRKADPNYRPDRDPKGGGGVVPWIGEVPTWAIIAIVLLAIVIVAGGGRRLA